MEEEGARRHGRGGGADLISALPEDLLLQVLLRLRCARAAARTSILSRRWRGLWVHLPDLTFRDVALGPLRSALASFGAAAVGPGVPFLDIAFTSLKGVHSHEQLVAGVRSLLHAAAGLSPDEFHLALPWVSLERADVHLPGFRRAISIHLYAPNLRLTLPRSSGAFPKLEKLSLSGCCVDLAALVVGCPCLRVLRVSEASLDAAGINIQSDSLQKLIVRTNYRRTDCINFINVDAPMLNQLTLSFRAATELSVSVVAPILEKVSWGCAYSRGLSKVQLYAAESLEQGVVTGTGEDASLQLCKVYVLSLQISPCEWFDAALNFVKQMQIIEKHLLFVDFSVFELTVEYDYGTRSFGHVFGPFVLHLLGSHRICTATRRLQVLFMRSKVRNQCPVDCLCDERGNWRSKNISLINLEEVEIKGFQGEDHELDFLRVIFSYAPMLKRMSVRMSHEATTSNDQCTKIHEVFKAYPFVECNVDLCSGSMRSSQSCALT